MTWTLARKLMRDIRLPWIVAAVLLFLFQLIWARLTQRVTAQIITEFQKRNIPPELLDKILFENNEISGKMVQAVIGGESIQINRAGDMMSIAYVHPLVMTILCIWAIGRAANAIAGEIDRGTMELLLAQPIRRTQIILAHLFVDAIIFPALCLILWTGTYNATWLMGLQDAPHGSAQYVDPMRFLPALLFVVMLLFSVSGMTMWISSMGRSRARVWGMAASLILCMFLVNVLGQIWTTPMEWLRPFTIFYHYQPQDIILQEHWFRNRMVWQHLAVLASVGAGGYLLAWLTFCRRDLPAPL